LYFLGIFGLGPNPAAALLKGTELIAIGEEERFSRIKNAPGVLPIKSIIYCLNQANITLKQVSQISFAWDCPKYVNEQPVFFENIRKKFLFDDGGYNELYENRLFTIFHPQVIAENLKFGLAKEGEILDVKKIVFLNHHECHAASTYFASGFNKSLIFTIDGSGEEKCTVEWLGSAGKLSIINSHDLPNSLGGFYSTFTEFLGFKSDSEEGKLMGLAPYGEFDKELQNKLSKVLIFDEKLCEYSINPEYRFYSERSFNSKFTDLLVKKFGLPRTPISEISKYHQNLAYNVQWRLEHVVSKIIQKRLKEFKVGNVCLAGGVAMNCKMNGVISDLPEVKKLFVQPASSDNGTALGAALISSSMYNPNPAIKFRNAYWGREYSNVEVEAAIKEAKLKYKKNVDIFEETLQALMSGKIIAWFQGRSEIGARSLGNRSILANPLIQNMKDKLNLEVKHRESWRPFCPSFTEESFPKYFGHNKPSEFMIIAYNIKSEFIDKLPSAVHIDGSVRPQSVSRSSNPRFHKLLESFGKKSGHPVLINTSFNIQGEPIVETPRDALRCFGGTGIDMLVINDFIIKK